MAEQARDGKPSVRRKARELKDSAARVRELWRCVSKGDYGQIQALLELISSLAINGATHGHPAVTQQSAGLSLALQLAQEQGFKGDLRPLHAGIDRLELELLKASQQQGPSAPSAPRLFQSVERMVYLVDEDELHAEWVEGLLCKANFGCRKFVTLQELREALGNGPPPLAIILSMDKTFASLPVERTCRLFDGHLNTIPLICISELVGFASRLLSVRQGVDYFLYKPLDVSTLISLLEDLVECAEDEVVRVLYLSQDGLTSGEHVGLFQQAGFQVRLLDDPDWCIRAVDEFRPDMVIVDSQFGVYPGFEVACTLRQETEYANLPILVLSGPETVPPEYSDILAGDILVAKPIALDRLMTLVQGQVGRARRVNQYVKHLFREIRHKEFHDVLTGLPNKKQLEKRLELELRNINYGVRKRMALLLIDIDNFQYVNDAYGHESGDNLIIDLAKRLSTFLPDRAFISRQGGDEFAVLLVNLVEDAPLETYLNRLMKVCEAPFSIQGDEIRIGLSVGATDYHKTDEDFSEKILFKQADMALFRAKDAGRNGYVIFRSSMDAELKVQITLLSDLRQALEREELFLVYQPQLDLHDGELIGAEVLLRWKHPKRGMISPGEFIPLAEAHGLIGELGNYVLRNAIQQIAQWQRRFGRAVRLAVNVSPRQFSEVDFVKQVAALLKFSSVEGRWLELEITESALASDLEQAVGKLVELRDLSVSTAIDDFGTGFSNLASLKRYPVDLLKIDRSFVQGLPGQENDIAIVNAIIQLAKALGLKLLAEGVETPSQRDHLRAHQCDYVQGFLFARPMPKEEFEAQYLQSDTISIIKR